MARVTVEDCIERIPNHFDLVLIASQRARSIASGSPILVARERDKDTVVSLREIAEGRIDIEAIAVKLSQRLQRGVQKVENEAVGLDASDDTIDEIHFDTVSEEELLSQLRQDGIEPESSSKINPIAEDDSDI